jgi:NAD(P)-dependent dehydrogenase (short-subunit alcohol dehydrogenase family)
MSTSTSSSRVAVVTGGARGIGLAIGEWFLARGDVVALLDIDATTLAATAKRLGAAHGAGRVLPIVCDVSQPAQVAAAFEQIGQAHGRVDALVNNAGVAVFKPLKDTSFEEWRHVLGTNLDGAFLCTQAAQPWLREAVALARAGAAADAAGASLGSHVGVVNIASISGLRASTLRVAYGTSKGALIHLTKQMAVEMGAAGIRCNAVAPGPVDTEMAKLVHSVAIRSDYHDVIPLNRYGTVAEIAQAVGFLCSAEASYINGQVLAADGRFDAMGVGLPTLRKNGWM